MAKDKMWKVLAIVFIILFVLETTLITLVFLLGASALENEQQCIDTCTNKPGAISYEYDEQTTRCTCSDDQGTIVYSQRL